MCLTVQMALALRLGVVGTSISKEDEDDDGRISVTRPMAPLEESVKMSRYQDQLVNVMTGFKGRICRVAVCQCTRKTVDY